METLWLYDCFEPKNCSDLYHLHPLKGNIIIVDLSHCPQQLSVKHYVLYIKSKHSILSHVDRKSANMKSWFLISTTEV